jgi:hypothetical protein
MPSALGFRLASFRVNAFEFRFQSVEFRFGKVFQIHKARPRFGERADQLVQFKMQSAGVTVLSVLNQKDHQERDNGRARIDDQLPGIGKSEERAGGRPNDYDDDRDEERPSGAHRVRGVIGNIVKQIAYRSLFLIQICVANFSFEFRDFFFFWFFGSHKAICLEG